MDMAVLSMVMSQSRVQQSAGIVVMKIAMNAGKENAARMTGMLKNIAVDSNLGNHIDVSA
mgnify:CR=1 FL=1|jgi:hypothetical protein